MSRYEEYKDSYTTWMGEIPSHWKVERAKWHFTIRNERGNDVPVLLAATQKYGMYPQDMIEGVVKVAEGTDVQQFKTVHKGDFVISLRSFQGGFERSDYEGVCSPAYQVFFADEIWDKNYLKYLLKNELFIDAMNALTVGIREGRNIKYEEFANSVLAIPPLAEQIAIAEYLAKETERIDAIINEAKTSIEEYKAWKSSIIYEAVTKGLESDVKKQDSCTVWMGQVPSHWKLERAKWHFTIRNERGNDTPVLLAATQKYGMYPQDMIEGVVKVAEGTDVQQFKTVHKGDFVISLRSFQGGFERSDYEGVCSPAYQVFYADDCWSKDYLKYLFKNELFIDAMNSLTVGIREGRNIKYEEFANSVLAIPPLAEQIAIAQYLGTRCKEIDDIVAEKQALIIDLEAYKKSLIYEIVTGKRKVV